MAEDIQATEGHSAEAVQQPDKQPKKAKGDPWTELKKTMYNRPLERADVDMILSNTEDVHLVYHSVSGGIVFRDDLDNHEIFRLLDKGEITHVDSNTLKFILDNIPSYSRYLYDLFNDGIITFIDYESFHGAVDNVASIVYAEAYKGQKSLHNMSNGVFTGFASNDNKNDLNEGKI